MPLNAQGCLIDMSPQGTPPVDLSHAPPLYGQHVLDQLYAGIDQSGLMTPAPQSGMNTPFHNHSRNGSSENLASLLETRHPAGAVTPAALSSRLQNLDISSLNMSLAGGRVGQSSGANTPHPLAHGESEDLSRRGNVASRRASEEDEHRSGLSNLTSGQHTPEHIDYSDLGDLTKVPSYSTAVRTPVPTAAYSDSLPNYAAAVSAPPSPSRAFSHPATPSDSISEE